MSKSQKSKVRSQNLPLATFDLAPHRTATHTTQLPTTNYQLPTTNYQLLNVLPIS
ncbi:hypothetical protein [Chroococcidiopsis sp. CCNUC1]|uniref:hypothetical protein n=1 Tax=Chroococcidiopsis sp. CCNUC1 TaxID=2653189 RepID=UPI0020224DDF|nr:hypothetical protein [Chroococcidiopsis sp. CCNUC1]URD49242.1 hypothetical protein M5J74_23305 [Chroococcidiopsis sp. CCNUC1]